MVLVAMALLVMVVVMVLVAMALLVMVVVMMMLMLLFKSLYGIGESIAAFHSGKNILAVKVIPRSSNDGGVGIVLAKKLNALGNLMILGSLSMRENDCGRVCDLIVIELAKVLHIHLAFVYVGNGGECIKCGSLTLNRLCGTDYVGKLANSRGFDNNAIGIILLKHLCKRL